MLNIPVNAPGVVILRNCAGDGSVIELVGTYARTDARGHCVMLVYTTAGVLVSIDLVALATFRAHPTKWELEFCTVSRPGIVCSMKSHDSAMYDATLRSIDTMQGGDAWQRR